MGNLFGECHMFPITLLTLILSAYTKSFIPIFGQAHIKSDPSPVCIYVTYFFQECLCNYYTPSCPEGEWGILFYLCPSFRPSKIFFVTFFSATIDGRNLIFGHTLHICMPYCGYCFWTRQIPTSCLPT